jgi:hypothetical protein
MTTTAGGHIPFPAEVQRLLGPLVRRGSLLLSARGT